MCLYTLLQDYHQLDNLGYFLICKYISVNWVKDIFFAKIIWVGFQ